MKALFLLLLLLPVIFSIDCGEVTYGVNDGKFPEFVTNKRINSPNSECTTLTIKLQDSTPAYKSTVGLITVPDQTSSFNLILTAANLASTSRVSFSFGLMKSITLKDMNFFTLTTPINVNRSLAMTVSGCTFTKGYGVKSPTTSTAPITIKKSQFKDLDMSSNNNNLHGFSAVWAQGAVITVIDSQFSGIKGRAIKGDQVVSTNCYYDSNVMRVDYYSGRPTRGAAIFTTDVISLTNNFFRNNKAGNGGAVYSKATSVGSASGNTFIGNVAFGTAGTTNNGMGGAIYADSFNLGSNNHFESNTCTNPAETAIGGAGGAIAVATKTPTESSMITGSNVTFISNKAALGGAIYVTGPFSSSGVIYRNNEASGVPGTALTTGSNPRPPSLPASPLGGGAIYFANSTQKFTSLSDTFDGNLASSTGQAIYTDGDSIITSGSFSNNLGGSGGNPSIVVPNGKKLDLIGSNTFTTTNIILNGFGKVMKSGASVTILCDGTGRSPFGSNADGYTSCMASSTVFTRVLFSTSSDGKDLATLWSTVRGIVNRALADGDLYVDWAVRPAGSRRAVEVHDASATFVLPSLTTNTPSDSYKWANTLQQAAAISTLTTAGYTPTFGANSTNTYAKQSTGTNECAYQNSNGCSNNGYCVEPGSQGIGYCSCKSGFSQKQCQTETTRESQAVEFGSMIWEPELLISFVPLESKVTIEVILDSQESVAQNPNSYATTTFLRFGGSSSNGCNYPQNDKWTLTTVQSSNLWYDHYSQTFSYTDLIQCGLTRVNTDNTRYLFYNNTLNVERDYVYKQGTKFTFARKAKTNKPFSLMFPKTVATTSNIKVWNTTIEFFATVSQLNYITEDDKWHMKITTIIANNYRLKSKFVNEDETPTVPTVPPTDLSERNFMIVTETLNGDPKLPPLSCSTNEDCQQTFHFVFDKCKGFTISNYAFEFEVSCQPSKADCLPPQNTATVQLSLNAATEEKGSCPVDATFNPGAVMNSYDSGLTSTKTLFGMSETAYFAIDFTSPLQVDNIVIDNVCVHKTSQADGILCTTNIVDESIIGDRKGHRVAFSVLAKDLMTVSQTVGSGTVVVQADLTITYGSSFTSKRSVTMAPHSGTSVISLVDREVYEQSLLRGKLENEDAFVPSSATFFSASCALIFLVAFVAF